MIRFRMTHKMQIFITERQWNDGVFLAIYIIIWNHTTKELSPVLSVIVNYQKYSVIVDYHR